MSLLNPSFLLIASLASFAFMAGAAPITFNLTGQITDEAISGCGAVVNCGAVSVSYTFDSDAPDQNPDPVSGLYAVSGLSFSIDGVPFFTGTNSLITVANFGTVDQYGVLAFGTVAGFGNATLSILLEDDSGTAFSSDALLLNASALNAMLPGSFHLNASDDDAFQLLGTLGTLTVVPEPVSVPEPASGVLLALGMAALLSSRRLLILPLVFVALSPHLLAVDGLVLIDQNRAMAGGVTPGDAPGFPVTISVSGSFRLSGNLTVPDASTTAIDITTNYVSVDLNGFSIIGQTVCADTPVTSCSPTGAGNGISAASRTGISISNGTIRGMGGYGVQLEGSEAGSVERVNASSNGFYGIQGGQGLFIDNRVTRNGLRGLQTAANQIVRGNFAYGNKDYGIIAGCPGTVVNNTSVNNGVQNLFLFGSGCAAANNSAP